MPGRPAQGRILELDGLRGAAILSVLLGHYFAPPSVGLFRYFNGYWVRLGWTGVDLFFVLSGFLIGGILLEVRGSPAYFKTYYARRFFRIIPIYYAWIAAYIVTVVAGGSYFRAHGLAGTPRGIGITVLVHALFLQNINYWISGTISLWWFAVAWSLAVEEQFYLVSPLLVRRMSERALTVLLIAVVLTAPLLRFFFHYRFPDMGSWLAYRLMPCRADSLAMGMLAAILWRKVEFQFWLATHRLILYSVFAILLVGMRQIWRWDSDPNVLFTQTIGFTWIALFFTVLLLLVLSHPSGPVAYLARLRFLRDIGGVSYCIYLIHLAVFYLCHQILLHGPPVLTDGKTGAVTILAAVVSYGIAKLTWKFLESPMIERGHSYKY